MTEFLLGLNILKPILSNVSGLSQFLQEKNVDVCKAQKNAILTMKVLTESRTNENFEHVWGHTEILSRRVDKIL